MRSILWFIPAICVFIGILVLSTLLSVPIQIEGISFTDKLSHLFAYSVLAFTLLFAFAKQSRMLPYSVIWVIILCSIYGVFLEWVQYSFFPNRYFEWLDALVNVIGTSIGGLGFKLFTNG